MFYADLAQKPFSVQCSPEGQSLSLVQTLRKIQYPPKHFFSAEQSSSVVHCSVVTTLHNPESEEFSVYDTPDEVLSHLYESESPHEEDVHLQM